MFEKLTQTKPLIPIILVSTIVRCLIAANIDLGNDEVYYFTYATQPDWNHFDHPPLTGIFIRIFTLNLEWISNLSMRLPAILGAAINTVLIAKCGQLIKNGRTGFIAAILYQTSIYTGIIAGLFILPDSVQLVFWLAAIWCMLKISKTQHPGIVNKNLLLAGLWIGLAMMCKVHGLFLWIGFGGYILFHDRKLLSNPNLYFSILITLLIISPIVFWNVQNDFITWRFHSARIGANESSLNPKAFFTTLLGEFLYSNPLHFILYIFAVLAIFQRRNFMPAKFQNLLLWCSLPIILATTFSSVFRPTLPHWSGPGFIGLMLISAAYIQEQTYYRSENQFSRLATASVVLMFFVLVTGPLVINFYPGTLGKDSTREMGSNDFTLDMYGWHQFLPDFKTIRDDDIKTGRMSPDSPLLINKWFPGGHLYFYIAYPLKMRVVGSGEVNDLHKFVWLNDSNGSVITNSDAYFITPSNYFSDPEIQFKGEFRRISLAAKIPQFRNGKIARFWYIYRLQKATRKIGTVFSRTANKITR